MTINLKRDKLGGIVPQTLNSDGTTTVRANGDVDGINWRKTLLLRDKVGGIIPNQIYDAGSGKWILSEGGSGGGTGDSVDWTDVQNKPNAFPPTAHTHSYNDLDDKPNVTQIEQSVSDLTEDFTQHLAQDATKDKKGHVQIGDGLNVSNGVVSANYHIDHTVLPDKLSADFLTGETLTIPAVNNTSEAYAAWRDLIKTEINLPDITTTQPFRIVISTKKRTGQLIVQDVDVYMSIAPTGEKILSLHRVANFTDGGWVAWRITRNIREYYGNPNGVIFGYRGALLLDTLNGILYQQRTGLTAAYNTGWTVIGGGASV